MKSALLTTFLLSSAALRLSPVSRVVELLEGVAAKIEDELKKEEDLYESYVCWAKSVLEQKRASNEAAVSRIDELETYISDLDAGRVELTSERADLEKELEELNADIEAATALREKEKEDFEAAQKEMDQAIAALEDAVEVLGDATEDAKDGELFQMQHHATEGFSQRMADGAALSRAIELGKHVLTHGDFVFLQRLLSGEVPEADWKKLNRKATFKMNYKARSFKIQDVLKKMLSTFKSNLQEASDKEADAQTNYERLMSAKNEAKEKAENALISMEEEGGAKGMSRNDAADEVAALKTQKTNDEKFISQTEEALTAKKGEWTDRKMLRTEEIAAVNKAVAILHSDDNRDLFKRSMASQSFLQQKQDRQASRAEQAAAALRAAGRRANDRKLWNMAALVSGAQGRFDDVISSIDEMIALLKQQNDDDLANKESCETARMADARDAIVASRSIDDMSDRVAKLTADIVEIDAEVKAKDAEIASITEEMAEAKQQREREHQDWEMSNSDDTKAIEVVNSAKEVLENFYKENDLVFAQRTHRAPVVTAGEAPPPPPQTWDEPYGGKKQESGSIVTILTLIAEDMAKDQQKAKAEEESAQELYEKEKEESEDQIQDLRSDVSTLETTKGEKEEDIESVKGSRKTKKQELDNFMQKMADAEVGCDYIALNFEVRKKNRDVELDGLLKAKAILEGGAFPSI